MSYGSDKVAFMLLGGRSILGSLTDLEFTSANSIKPKTPLGTAAVVKRPTNMEMFQATQKGWFDESAGAAHEALAGSRGRSTQVLCLGFAENAVGAEAIGAAGAYTGTYKHGANIDDWVRADATYELSGAVDDAAVILAPLAARAGDWDTTSTPVNAGASSVAGLAAYLQVSSLTLGGYTSVTVKVRHSPDGVTYADLVTFTVITATDPTAERKTVAAGTTIQPYLAVAAAYAGAGAGNTMTAMVQAQRY